MRIWKSGSYKGFLFGAVVLAAIIVAGMGLSIAMEPKTADKGDALIEAGFRSDVEKIKQLLDEGTDVNRAVSDGYTALLEACTHPRPTTIEAVKLLLERGAKVNVVSNMGMTPLAGAVSTMADIEIIKLLLEHGANINAKIRLLTVPGNSTLELTVLHMAAQTRNQLVVQLLIQKGADVNCRDSFGGTPLMAAVSEGKLEVAKILIENGAHVNVRDNAGRTALNLAERAGKKQISALLALHGAKE